MRLSITGLFAAFVICAHHTVGFSVTESDANGIANAIFSGPGIILISSEFSGAASSSGIFTDGPFGIGNGGILTSGAAVGALPGGNHYVNNGAPGSDTYCGANTFNAAILTVDFFISPEYSGVDVEFILASEEEGGSPDPIGIFVGNTQFALDQSGNRITAVSPWLAAPLSIVPPNSVTSYPGSTPPFLIGIPISGANTMVITICDKGDSEWDSALLIKVGGCIDCDPEFRLAYVTTTTTLGPEEPGYTSTITASGTVSGTFIVGVPADPTTTTTEDVTTTQTISASETVPGSTTTQITGATTEAISTLETMLESTTTQTTDLTTTEVTSTSENMRESTTAQTTDVTATQITSTFETMLESTTTQTKDIDTSQTIDLTTTEITSTSGTIPETTASSSSSSTESTAAELTSTLSESTTTFSGSESTQSTATEFISTTATSTSEQLNTVIKTSSGNIIVLTTTSVPDSTKTLSTSGYKTTLSSVSIRTEPISSQITIGVTTETVHSTGSLPEVASTVTSQSTQSISIQSATDRPSSSTYTHSEGTETPAISSTTLNDPLTSLNTEGSTSTMSTAGEIATNLPTVGRYKFYGCMSSPAGYPTFSLVSEDQDMTTVKCISLAAGKRYIGMFDRSCYASDSLTLVSLVPNGKCDRPCPGEPGLYCGGIVSLVGARYARPSTSNQATSRRDVSPNILLTVYILAEIQPESSSKSVDPAATASTTSFTSSSAISLSNSNSDPVPTSFIPTDAVTYYEPTITIHETLVTTITYTILDPTDPSCLTVTKLCTTLKYSPCAKCQHQSVPQVEFTTITTSCDSCGPLGESTVTLTVPLAAVTTKTDDFTAASTRNPIRTEMEPDLGPSTIIADVEPPFNPAKAAKLSDYAPATIIVDAESKANSISVGNKPSPSTEAKYPHIVSDDEAEPTGRPVPGVSQGLEPNTSGSDHQPVNSAGDIRPKVQAVGSTKSESDLESDGPLNGPKLGSNAGIDVTQNMTTSSHKNEAMEEEYATAHPELAESLTPLTSTGVNLQECVNGILVLLATAVGFTLFL